MYYESFIISRRQCWTSSLPFWSSLEGNCSKKDILCGSILNVARIALWMVDLGMLISFAGLRIVSLGLLTSSTLICFTSFHFGRRMFRSGSISHCISTLNDRKHNLREFVPDVEVQYFSVDHFWRLLLNSVQWIFISILLFSLFSTQNSTQCADFFYRVHSLSLRFFMFLNAI